MVKKVGKKRKAKIHLINNYPSEICSLNSFKYLIQTIIESEKLPVKELNVIFVDDEYLRKLHFSYLNEDRYTDVMTFNLSDSREIEAEIYISYDRSKIQSRTYHVSIEDEIARLIVHGLLHLKGFKDHTEIEKQQIHQIENNL